jgi:DNA topoisomerase-1
MKAAQSLYESGHVTYIRTDSTRNSPESIDEVRDYLKNQGKSIPKTANVYSNKDAAQDAHEAIRPSNVSKTVNMLILDEDQKKIYDLIWRAFVCSQMSDAVYDTVNVVIKSSTGHEAKADGKILREVGWLDLAGVLVKKESDILLPIMNKGDLLNLSKVKPEKKKTSPPSRFNDGTLINELDKKEIGRPSTYAATIWKITDRKYVKKTSKGFQPTELGISVVNDLKEYFSFMDYKYTANMEKDLDRIAQGDLTYLEMMENFFNSFKEEFQIARNNQGMSTDLECPLCKDAMVVRKSIYGYFAGCIKYPLCKGIIGINISEGKVYVKGETLKTDSNVLCPECNAEMILREDGRFGPYYGCSKYPRCKGKRKVPFGKKCPKCNEELFATLFKEEMKLACMGYPNCKHIENIPEDKKVNWVNPEDVTPPLYKSKFEKVLK